MPDRQDERPDDAAPPRRRVPRAPSADSGASGAGGAGQRSAGAPRTPRRARGVPATEPVRAAESGREPLTGSASADPSASGFEDIAWDHELDTSQAEEERRAIFASLLADDPFVDEEPEPPEGPPPHVTCVLVSHDGARWLPTTLAALRLQERAPERVIAVDTGSTDASPRILTRALGSSRLVSLPATTGYGEAVSAALATHEVSATDREERREWVWLLHDDSAPDADALERLLAHAVRNPSLSVLGAKAVDWDHPDRLVEVGLSTDVAGRRETGLERGELDQGQHDQPRDVLAVGTAGMLVRRETWDALGGFDPQLPLLREDVDFGWRANLSGRRVAVVPAARVRHARATLLERRPRGPLVPHSVRRTDRAHALYVGAVDAGPLRVVRSLVGGLLRALVLLLTRRPGEALDELVAVVDLLLHLPVVVAGRRRRAPQRTVPRRAVRPLLTRGTARFRQTLLATTDRLSGSGELAISPDVDDDEEADDDSSVVGRLFLRPVVGLTVLLVAVALIADRHVLHGGALAGGRLLPVDAGATDLWRAYLGTWHDVAGGATTPASPWLPLLAVLSLPFGGNPAAAVTVLVLGAVPLAGLAAWYATRRAGLAVGLRLWAAATYAVLPVVTGAVDGGRFDAVVAIVAAPLLVRSGARLVRSGGGTNHAFALGLGIAVAAAFSPPVWTVAAVLLGGAALVGWVPARFGDGQEGLGTALRRVRDAAFALVVAPALLFPWTLLPLRHPRVLLVGLGGPGGVAGALDRAPGALQTVLLDPGGRGLAPAWFLAPVVLAALAGTTRGQRGRLALAAVAAAAGAAAVGLVAARVGAAPTGRPPQGWAGVGFAVAAVLLLAAVLVAAHDSRQALRSSAFGLRQPVAVLLAVLCAVVPAASAVWLLGHGVQPPLDRRAGSSLPVNIVHAGASDPGQRVLWLRSDSGRVAWSLEPVTGARLSDEDQRGTAAAQALLSRLVADLTSSRGTDAAETLATFHVRYVALATSGPLADVLDEQPALSRAASPGAVQLWQVLVPSSRLEVVTGAVALAARTDVPVTAGLGRGPTLDQLRTAPVVPVTAGPEGAAAPLPGGSTGRLLVLADAADRGWHATLDGRPLTPTTAWGWAQAFELPAGGGSLAVHHDQGIRHTELWVQLLLLVVVVVLAAPNVRRQEEEPEGPVAGSLEPDEIWDLDELTGDGEADDAEDAADGPVVATGDVPEAAPGEPVTPRRRPAPRRGGAA